MILVVVLVVGAVVTTGVVVGVVVDAIVVVTGSQFRNAYVVPNPCITWEYLQ